MEYIGCTFSQTEEFVLNMAIEKTIEATWCSREENVPALIYPRRIVENFFLFTLLSSLTPVRCYVFGGDEQRSFPLNWGGRNS